MYHSTFSQYHKSKFVRYKTNSLRLLIQIKVLRQGKQISNLKAFYFIILH
jgi:hypothetical protein